ncbi:Fic family protein [Candidatus Woesearchaeota archaeon]|nr:Fic family protein [Candidatus Woesearchaeota archaeon]
MNEELYRRIKQKKKQLDNLRPFPKTALERLKDRLRLLFTYNSNAIEGNTLTLSETKLVVQEGITIGGKSLREHNEAINHQKAIEFIEQAVTEKKQITEELLCELHGIILGNIEEEEKGMYRKRKVWIEGASFVPAKPDLVPKLMKDFFVWLNTNPEKLNEIELAAIAHEKFVFIHPFIDGNGRVGRLLTSLMLMQKGFPPLIVLKTERQKYIRVLEAAHNEKYESLVNFMGRCLERSLVMYLEALETKIKENKEYISLQEATKYCDYSQEYLSLLARRGLLEAVKFQRDWMTTREAIKEYNSRNKK